MSQRTNVHVSLSVTPGGQVERTLFLAPSLEEAAPGNGFHIETRVVPAATSRILPGLSIEMSV